MYTPGREGPAEGPAEAPAEARGFMLVGVVMFMLALTILGMSLFALSSYEAQFYTASASREQSMQHAESGMELVKALLQMPPHRLENAQLAVGQCGITSAIAYQRRGPLASDTTSQGPVQWSDSLLLVVTAGSRGAERTIQAQFTTTPGQNPYKQLLSAGTGIRYNLSNGTPPQGFEIRGGAWQFVQTSSDTAWTQKLRWPEGRPMLTTPAPRPLGNAFVGSKLLEANDPPGWSGDHAPYTLTLINPDEQDPEGTVKFFRSPVSPADANEDEDGPDEFDWYSFYVDKKLTIRIKGTVVLLVPQGACFKQEVAVEPIDEGVPSTLIIVARPNENHPGFENRGLWFMGGLNVTHDNARVYLVSEGDIGFTREENDLASMDADQVTIVAGGSIELGGPRPGYIQRVEYEPPVMDALADVLIGIGALPPLTAGTSVSYILARSTWAETTPR